MIQQGALGTRSPVPTGTSPAILGLSVCRGIQSFCAVNNWFSPGELHGEHTGGAVPIISSAVPLFFLLMAP